jgi:hypothetical protein
MLMDTSFSKNTAKILREGKGVGALAKELGK